MVNKFAKFIIFYLFATGTTLCQDTCTKNINILDTNSIYPSYILDELPKFKAGNDSLDLLIQENIVKPSFNIGYEGVISICLTINRSGELVKIHILGNTENTLFQKYERELKSKIAYWHPGKKRGVPVNSMICLPIIIRIR